MEFYVNSGNTIVHQENRYHSGTVLPDEIVDLWTKEDIERLVGQGVISEKEPKLDPVVDSKSGSASVKKGSPRQKSENFSSKQLSKELTEKDKKTSKTKGGNKK